MSMEIVNVMRTISTTGSGSFPGVKQPGRCSDDPPHSKSLGHERVGLYLYSPAGTQWPAIGRSFTPLCRPYLSITKFVDMEIIKNFLCLQQP